MIGNTNPNDHTADREDEQFDEVDEQFDEALQDHIDRIVRRHLDGPTAEAPPDSPQRTGA